MKNLVQSRPLHYDDFAAGIWGDFLIEVAKDIAAERVLLHLEDAATGPPPFCTTYLLGKREHGKIQWWDDKHDEYRTTPIVAGRLSRSRLSTH
jgi:hypothetical protein